MAEADGIVLAEPSGMKITTAITLFVLALPLAAAGSPPAGVEAAFETAQTALDDPGFRGSYTVGVSSVVAKADGSKRQVSDMAMTVAVNDDGRKKRLLRLVVDGEDVTEDHREDIEAEGDGEDDDDIWVTPFGTDSKRFVFGPSTVRGDVVHMDFEPAPDHEKDKGITRGALEWHAVSSDPIRIRMEVLNPPKPVREFSIVMEFERLGDTVYLSRMVNDGRVKVLLMKRTFHMEMTVSDLVPRP